MIGGSSEEPKKTVPASEVLVMIRSSQPVAYDHVTVTGNLNLSKLIVRAPIRINDSVIDGIVNFSGTVLNSSADFRFSKFNGPVDFWGARLNSPVYFYRSTFNDDVYFVFAAFNIPADFYGTTFNSPAHFFGTTFNSSANFVGSTFNSADFGNSKFSKDAFFIGARLKVLDLGLAKYEKLYLRWSSIDRLVYDANYGDTTYQLLMENFKNLGFSSDFDNCYYQFRVEQFLHRNYFADPLGSLLDFGAWIFYGFGKRPLYPLSWSIVIVFFFGAFWRRIEDFSLTYERIIYEDPGRSGVWDKVHLVLKPFVLSATIFLSGTKLFVESPEIPESPRSSRSFVKGMFTFERILGAFFSILLFIAISGTVIR